MTPVITWIKDIKPMLAVGVVPDMLDLGYPLDDYDFVKGNYRLLHSRMADGSMPPGVSGANIAFIQKWIDDGAPADGYARVQDILDRAIGGKTSIGAHGKFWRGVGRDDFVKLSVYGRAVITANDGVNSNLVKALKGEPPFDGSASGFERMPAGFWWTDEQRSTYVQMFEQWQKDGFPEGRGASTMTGFQDVVTILDDAVGGPSAPVGVHGAFWRGTTRDAFVGMQVLGLPLIQGNDGAGSSLVKALKGEPPFDGSQFPRMPARRPPVPPDRIQTIQDWIDDGSPA